MSPWANSIIKKQEAMDSFLYHPDRGDGEQHPFDRARTNLSDKFVTL